MCATKSANVILIYYTIGGVVTSDKLWDGWSLSHDAIGVIGAYRGVITGYLYEAGASILE